MKIEAATNEMDMIFAQTYRGTGQQLNHNNENREAHCYHKMDESHSLEKKTDTIRF